MGRALFSTIYAQPVAVHTEPDVPDHLDFTTCEKWSISNPFDPDSDEFYEGATREVFTDTEAWRQEQEEAVRELLVAQVQGTESSSSSEASESESGSPMAVGSDDPALLIADAFPGADWSSHLAAIGASPDWVARIAAAQAEVHAQRVTRRRSSTTSSGLGFIPPSPFHRSLVDIEPDAPTPVSPPHSPTLRRTIPINPISLPSEPSSPSPPSPATPSTPSDNVYEMSSMLTPSPLPSVSPQVYTWHRAQSAVPASPLANMSNAAGPLTNPSARLSYVRLNVAPTRVRIHNAAV